MTKQDMLRTATLYPNQWTCYDCFSKILPLGLLLNETNNSTTQSQKSSTATKANQNTTSDKPYTPYKQLIFNGENIERVTNIKFLGVILTDTLNWNDHMLYVCTKMNKSIGYFYKARQILDQEQMINLYKSFVEPDIPYCLPIWGGYVNCKGSTNPITKTINRFKRIMTYSKRTYIADTKISLTNLYDYYTVEFRETSIQGNKYSGKQVFYFYSFTIK